MNSQNTLPMEPSAVSAALPCSWRLDAGRAVTMRPHEAGVLSVAHGQIWATLQGPHRGRGNELGDHFLLPGESLTLRAGQRVVLEAWDAASQAPAWFKWDPQAAAARPAARGWRVAVAQPLGDLRRALGRAAGAAARLAMGFAGFTLDLVAARTSPERAERALSADSSASRAQGVMNCGDSIASCGAL